MRPYLCCLLLACIVGSTGCMKTGVTGKYMANFTNGAYWLQLVETKDGHITGQFEEVLINPDGKVVSNSLSVKGAADGKDLSLSLEPLPGLPLFSTTASGTLASGKLHLTGNLTGNGPVMVEFVPSNQESFSREVANINDRSRLMLVAKARIEQERQREVQIAEEQQRREREEAGLTNTLRNTIARMDHLGVTQQANAPKFAAIQQRYEGITAKMEAYLSRERQLSRNPNAGVQRSQIIVALNQGTIDTDQIHTQVQNAASEFEQKVGALFQEVTRLEQTCRNYPAIKSGPVTNSVSGACGEFLAALPSFREHFDATGKAFVSAEEKYLREQHNQARIEGEAQRIE